MDIQNANAVPRVAAPKNTRALLLFSDSIDAHIAALHAACRDLLAQKDANGAPTREVRIEIRSSLDPAAPSEYSSPTTDRSIECWDHTYPCGKDPNGYVYCSVRVCMIVESVSS